MLSVPLPTADEPEALALARGRHAVVAELLERLTPEMQAGTFPATSWVQVSKYADELVRLIAELTPPKPRDPNEDENAIEAERVFLERLAGLIEAAERRTSP